MDLQKLILLFLLFLIKTADMDNPPDGILGVLTLIPLKHQTNIAADDILIFLLLSFEENRLDVSSESSA